MNRKHTHRSTPLAAMAIAFALSACASAHESRDVGTGVYELEVRGDADACSPARSTGRMGEVGVVSRADVLNLALPASFGLSRLSLSRSSDWHGATDTPIEGCAGAWVHREWSIDRASADGFELGWIEEWRGLDTCVAPSSIMPDADCRADLVLDYRLMEACGDGCELRESGDGARCVCF